MQKERIGNGLMRATLTYASKDWPVFPANPQNKRPFTSNGFKGATTDPDTIRTWWQRWPNALIGAPTGEVMGCWVLDVDALGNGHKADGLAALAWLEKENAPLQTGLEQRTGGGGRQLFFAWDASRPIRNSRGNLPAGIDVRGDGGYVILPPSGHPSGGRYEWLSQGGPASAPAWLLDIIDPPRSKHGIVVMDSSATDETTPYGKQALEAEAGKVARAVEGERDNVLNTAAFRIGQLVAGNEIDQQEAEDELTRAGLRCGLSEREVRNKFTRPGGDSPFECGMREPRTAPAGGTPYKPSPTVGVDDKTDDQGYQHKRIVPPPAPFPVEVFPPAIRAVIEQAERAFGVPSSIPSAAMLMLSAACIGRTRGILIKQSWCEYANLFMALVARSGMGKSPCVNAFFRSIHRVEKRLQAEYDEAMAQYWADKTAYDQAPKKERGQPPEEPQRKHLYVDDATIEAVADALLMSGSRGVLWYRDELAGMLKDFDKYGTGDKGGTMTRLLSAYDSSSWKLTRKTNKQTIYIPQATVSLFGGIQDGVLPHIFTDLDAVSGFLPRILFVRAEQDAPPLWTEEGFEDIHRQTIDQITERLLSYEMTDEPSEKARIIGVAGDAKKAFIAWHDKLAYEQWLSDADHKEALPKLRGQALRLALNLHCLWAAAEDGNELEPVQLDTMNRALTLAEWFKGELASVWAIIRQSQGVTTASPLDKRVAAAIITLKAEVAGGMLPTARITEAVNDGMDKRYQVDPRAVGKAYSKLGLHSQHLPDKKGRGVVLTPDDIERLEGLLPKQTSETSHMSQSQQQRGTSTGTCGLTDVQHVQPKDGPRTFRTCEHEDVQTKNTHGARDTDISDVSDVSPRDLEHKHDVLSRLMETEDAALWDGPAEVEI
ncbi:DUF3987 domain-containing protein [Oceanidesulfovibrio marinus]|nr:DUF3987 domain-containing protein [Oceanidesulfovibrio marinus]